jgi:hypothetical protein
MDDVSRDTIWWTSDEYKKRQQTTSTINLGGIEKKLQLNNFLTKDCLLWTLSAEPTKNSRQKIPFHYGSSMASSLCKKHVYPPNGRRIGRTTANLIS